MANRPVFVSVDKKPYVETVNTDFVFYSGFALSQAQKSICSLHSAFELTHKGYDGKILEISSKSMDMLGSQLSAFNLMSYLSDGSKHSVETIYQASKCFDNGCQYLDLLNKSSYDAKRDERLHTSGDVIAFRLEGVEFPIKPVTFFYNWLYINAVNQNPGLAQQIVQFSAFTDIAFNPAKSLNCQARSVAIYVGLVMNSRLQSALQSPSAFYEEVYAPTDANLTDDSGHQLSIWEL